MSKLSLTEENYLKTIYMLTERSEAVHNQSIAQALQNTPASVSDMLKKLTKKGLIQHEPYKPIQLTSKGREIAINIVRKHRLWETFLVKCLGFTWEQIHPIAEQLEHIESDLLISRLDEYLGYPKYDPHGDPIPSPNGDFQPVEGFPLSQAPTGKKLKVVAVKNDKKDFLNYLNKINLFIGSHIYVIDRISFDLSIEVDINNKVLNLSHLIASQIIVNHEDNIQ
ncbi:DtxR family Mn-dependent transcriptional regulator [Thermonema lapsum]|uniref:Transcriptional regulator MntR n=1 Tax=Thermonema lapsum TaxID=28195 RepID=A0A846MMV2_9BACT|nr:metal-dependent transcriptional regulator [Thermonema lapsum]NIK72876.1 DtxR family Mn-dependent transcriptional regulator [Thermonema lapsum]